MQWRDGAVEDTKGEMDVLKGVVSSRYETGEKGINEKKTK